MKILKVQITYFFVGVFLINTLYCIRTIGGNFKYKPNELEIKLSPGAKGLLKQALTGIDASRLMDYHTHLLGLGQKGTGAFVNAKMLKWYNFFDRAKFKIYMSASGIENEDNADREYVNRLVDLIRNIPKHGKYYLLGFDKNYNEEGKFVPEHTEFYIPNEYVEHIRSQYPELFEQAISVHPYRKDALIALEKWAKKGIKLIKWLPNAMGIDPSHPSIEPYYQIVKKYNMTLLVHLGEEKAVHAEEAQRYGNPLLLRKPLDMGVRVIAAHCASLGQGIDLEDKNKRKVDNFDLFLRLMREPRYEKFLYADISAMTQFNRLSRPLKTMLEHTEWHGRLVNGSDYPLPAINIIIRTKDLVSEGFITEKEREYLNEIYSINPLLFDFVVKRTVRSPETGSQFSAEVFYKKFE